MLLGQTPVLKFLDQCPYKVLGTLNQEPLIKKKIRTKSIDSHVIYSTHGCLVLATSSIVLMNYCPLKYAVLYL